jgi:hypothetical protein
VVEYDNPPFFLLRGEREVEVEKRSSRGEYPERGSISSSIPFFSFIPVTVW